MTRPRAADDFATIHARLTELRRERERASQQDACGDDNPPRGDGDAPRALESRPRPDKNSALKVLAGRRYGPGRLR